MSRLADAESKLAAALDALEAALETALEAAVSKGTAATGAAGSDGTEAVDSAMIITEIGRIDEQLAHAMDLIADIRRGAASEGGNA